MASVIKVACKHCGKEINFPAPPQAGVYVLTCPYCQGQMKVKYNPKPIIVANPTQPIPMATPRMAAAAPSMQAPPPPQPNMNDVRHKETRRFDAGQLGSYGMPGAQPQAQVPSSGFGRLSLVRLGADKEYFPLRLGENVVGRKDFSKPSDIQIDGDMTISRRSVRILVSPANGGYTYQLTVLSAANPVRLNGALVAEGQTVPMAMGASLLMGQTILRLEK